MTKTNMLRVSAAIFVAILLGMALSATAVSPSGSCVCPDVFAPVICSDNVVYSNLCQADCAGATGCVPYGGGV